MLSRMLRPAAVVDVEWVAFATGLKPALRRAVSTQDVDASEARLRAQGAPVVLRSEVRPVGGRDVVVLYAARRREDAGALRELEAAVGEGPEAAPLHREIGRRLGFPRCCTEAFCERVARGVDRLAPGGPDGFAEDYAAARDAWVPRPESWVNNLWMAARAQLVSFYPCRYDCPVAVGYARALHERVAARAPSAAAEVLRLLRRALVIAPGGARVAVTLEGGRVLAAEAVVEGPDAEALARALVGAVATPEGRIETSLALSLRGEPPWLLDFRSRPRP